MILEIIVGISVSVLLLSVALLLFVRATWFIRNMPHRNRIPPESVKLLVDEYIKQRMQ